MDWNQGNGDAYMFTVCLDRTKCCVGHLCEWHRKMD